MRAIYDSAQFDLSKLSVILNVQSGRKDCASKVYVVALTSLSVSHAIISVHVLLPPYLTD